MNRTLFVDGSPAVPGNNPDGSIQKPFRTIQDAVNAASALQPPPSLANRVAILIMQGVYPENLFVDQDGLVLRGMGGLGTVRIRPAKGPALVVSNATLPSVNRYIASNDRTLLAAGPRPSPRGLHFVDLGFESAGATASVYVVGQPDPTRRLGDDEMIAFSHCELRGAKSLHAYFTSMIWLRHNTEVYGSTEIFNCGGIWIDDSSTLDVTLVYDMQDPSGTPLMAGYGNRPGGQFGIVGMNAFFIGPVEIRSNATLPPPQPTIASTFWDLTLRQTARFEMIGGTCNAVTTEGGASWIAQDVHVQTNLKFDAGPGLVQLDGGRYMGSLTDAAGKFVRNVGK